MWLSKRTAEKDISDGAEIGRVTIGGESVGVLAGSERRNLRVSMPGGYFRKPGAGDEMLVIKCADGTNIAAGVQGSCPAGMQNGEVYIKSDGGAAIWLKNDGSIVFTGDIQVTGGLSVNGNEIS